MINTMAKLIEAYYSLLNGQLSYASKTVNVYLEDAPEDETYHYVLLRAESETYAGNKRSFADNSVVVVDIVTIFQNNIDRSVVDDIDGQIGTKILTTPQTSGLTNPTGIRIDVVERQTTNYLTEEDGINKYYRKVSRYNQRVLQTT